MFKRCRHRQNWDYFLKIGSVFLYAITNGINLDFTKDGLFSEVYSKNILKVRTGERWRPNTWSYIYIFPSDLYISNQSGILLGYGGIQKREWDEWVSFIHLSVCVHLLVVPNNILEYGGIWNEYKNLRFIFWISSRRLNLGIKIMYACHVT